jgi:hypothetical protein
MQGEIRTLKTSQVFIFQIFHNFFDKKDEKKVFSFSLWSRHFYSILVERCAYCNANFAFWSRAESGNGNRLEPGPATARSPRRSGCEKLLSKCSWKTTDRIRDDSTVQYRSVCSPFCHTFDFLTRYKKVFLLLSFIC